MPKKTAARKSKKGFVQTTVIALLVLLLVLLLSGVIYYFAVYQHENRPVVGGQREADALRGTLNHMTDEEIQQELDRIVDEGMFRISIASDIVGVEGGKHELRIENHFTNRYLMQVSLYLDETGEEIYATDLIDPGYYIREAAYDKPLVAGVYPATAIFTALYPDTGEIVGTVGAQVELHVMPAGTTPTPEPTATPSPSPTIHNSHPTPTPSPEADQ